MLETTPSCAELWLTFGALPTVLIASLRSSIALSGVFFFLTITFMLLGIAEFVPAHAVGIKTAGGAFGEPYEARLGTRRCSLSLSARRTHHRLQRLVRLVPTYSTHDRGRY